MYFSVVHCRARVSKRTLPISYTFSLVRAYFLRHRHHRRNRERRSAPWAASQLPALRTDWIQHAGRGSTRYTVHASISSTEAESASFHANVEAAGFAMSICDRVNWVGARARSGGRGSGAYKERAHEAKHAAQHYAAQRKNESPLGRDQDVEILQQLAERATSRAHARLRHLIAVGRVVSLRQCPRTTGKASRLQYRKG